MSANASTGPALRAARIGALLIACIWAVPARANPAIVVRDCRTTVPPGSSAILGNDIVCESRCSNDPSIDCAGLDSLCPDAAPCLRETLQIGNGSRLFLDRHRVSIEHRSIGINCAEETFSQLADAGVAAAAADPCGAGDAGGVIAIPTRPGSIGVRCANVTLPAPEPGRCIVDGPGSIVGAPGGSFGISSRTDLTVRNVFLDGAGIDGFDDVLVDNVSFQPFKESTITGSRVRARNMTIGSSGIIANSIVVENVVLADSSGGLYATFHDLRGHDVTTFGKNVISAENKVVLSRLRMTPLPAHPSDPQEPDYVRGKRVSLVDSVVRVILSEKRPRLIRTQCEHAPSWGGLCSDDPS